MRIALLGPVRVLDDDARRVMLGGARSRALVARLALDAGRAVTSDALIDDLWDGAPPADAANALQALVSRLRKALRGVAVVESVPGGYRLAVLAADVDALRFEELAAGGGRELVAGRAEAAARLLGEALDLWSGQALADLPDLPFAGAAALRLADLRIHAAEDRFDAALRLGRHTEVLAELEDAGTRHPLRERLAGLRMRALYAAGRQADALAAYERTRAALAEELGVDPSAELRETHLAMLRGEFAAPGRAPRGRLPARLTSFVGREEELDLLAGLLETARLVTVVGPGGAGKTRLALEAATRHRAHERGRVWFVPLAGVTAPERSPGAPGRSAEAVLGGSGRPAEAVLGASERPADSMHGASERLAEAVLGAVSSRDPGAPGQRAAGRAADPVERVADLLGADEAVLVLDNCEHLLDAAAGFGRRLLDRLPYLTILATSREALAVTGETLCRLAPLAEPAAVRLFVDRARAVRPDFELDADTSGPVAEICRRLDGLPLALELAAARLRSMPVGQIARRLDDRFRLLTSGDRAALPRQRTLAAVVEWSWELLSEPEQALARRMSIFPDEAGVAAVEAVCADPDGGPLPAEDVVYVLGSLVEKSIVQGDGRYRMLETVRVFAAERLRQAGERAETSARFVAFFRNLMEEQEPVLLTGAQVGAKDVIEGEYDNLVSALRVSIDDGDADSAWRLLGPLWLYWNARFDARAEAFLAEVLEFGDALPAQVLAAFTAMHRLANNSGSLPDPAEARAVIEDVHRTGAIDRYPMLAVIAIAPAYFLGFDDLLERELPRAMRHPHPWARAAAHWVDAFVLTDRGDWRGGAQRLAVTLALFEGVGDRYGLAMTLMSLARVHSVEGDYGTAVAMAERAVALAAEFSAGEEVMYRSWLAGLRMRGGDQEGAAADVAAARRRVVRRAQPYSEIELLLRLADLHRRGGEVDRAERTLDRLEAFARELSIPAEAAAGRVAAARLADRLADGAAGRARDLLPAAILAAFAARDPASAAEHLARLLLLEDDPAGAATALGTSQAIRGVFDRGEPELRDLVAELTARLGEQDYRAAYRRGAEMPRPEALNRLAELT
ncbi:BTAD domain-containing putative transcriptional regulator [Nonomuraea fuscirosea]|uniref:BTAD domain-containing putative transcriptional regulator n=1 Tax=Nonomuraea fuscirosea TaxID=1291556 RepID=UPI0034233DC1